MDLGQPPCDHEGLARKVKETSTPNQDTTTSFSLLMLLEK